MNFQHNQRVEQQQHYLRARIKKPNNSMAILIFKRGGGKECGRMDRVVPWMETTARWRSIP
ncbi:hypothetical protein OUZ56_031386 [Daphnia magna]|uniref:Uncharacterized protein n=1 Tax=Daphnia magna TaxID=35525 RepID=A0ABQ9ZUX3_9CRUS|nr:hypothetical protein OUZ56_031386 [Daphnia magna]